MRIVTKHEIVYQLYPEVTGCRTKEDGTIIGYKGQSEVSIDQDAVNAEFTKQEYKNKRSGVGGTTDTIYPEIGEQLDSLYKDIIAGKVDATGEFAKAIKATKDKYPKP